jgi:hypothetical protein
MASNYLKMEGDPAQRSCGKETLNDGSIIVE